MEPESAEDKLYQKCLDKAFLLISIRMQTEHELWEKLNKKSDKSTVFMVILRLKKLGYVDDSRFATLWVESRSRNHGANSLRTELIKKGIKREIIDETLATLNYDQQLEAAREIIKTKDIPEYTKEERFKKLGGLLGRRGFSYDIIKKALDK